MNTRTRTDIAEAMLAVDFARVLTSPLQRAKRTCELAGFHAAEVVPDLAEWDNGD